MTENREFNASSIEKAVEKASEKLGIPEESLSYEVLDSGNSGFLGMGSRDARIMVSSDTPANESTTALEEQLAEREVVPEANGEGSTEDPATPNEAMSGNDRPDEWPEVSQGLLSEVEQFAVHATEAMGLDAVLDVYDTAELIAVDVKSSEAGLFIGQKGETIDAFQYLLNVAIYRDRPYVKRIVVDSEGYRQRRVEAVQGIAHRMARKAVREDRLVELPPMNTSERRVVHMFLRDNAQVSTASQGSGDNRRVTVSPSK